MSRILIIFPGTLILLVFVISCETDFDTTTNYEDITVVYGLLDRQQQTQFIKINKAFLSETDVLTYANDPDSLNYPYPIDVYIQEINANGDVVNTYEFDTTTVYDKEDGIFYSDEQILYKYTAPDPPIGYEEVFLGGGFPVDTIPLWLNSENTYKLFIKNSISGKEVTSETTLVSNFGLKLPFLNLTVLTFEMEPNAYKKITWEVPFNASRFEFNMLFHYGEVRSGADTSYNYIQLSSNIVTTEEVESEVSIYYYDDTFFTSCDHLIPYQDPAMEAEVLSRFSSFVEIKIAAAENNFANYLEINEPSTSIIQDKPQYSNIENGIGIFSGRSNYYNFKKISGPTGVKLSQYYQHLKFIF